VALAVLAAWLAAFVPGVGARPTATSRACVDGRRLPFLPGALSAPEGGGGSAVSARATSVLGTGRASASYLLLAQRVCESCGNGADARCAAERRDGGGVAEVARRAGAAEACLVALREVRFRADAYFTLHV
jgi:hypothetical protein